MEKVEVGKHLVADPLVCQGRLTFKGTHVPIQAVLTRLENGWSIAKVLENWPELRREAVEEAVSAADTAKAAGFDLDRLWRSAAELDKNQDRPFDDVTNELLGIDHSNRRS